MSLNKYDKRNIPRYIKTASMITKYGDLLDIGARTAVLKEYISTKINYQVIDIDREAVLELRRRGIKANIQNAEDIQFNKNTFDTVVMGEVLEHIPNMGLVLQEVYRVLKDDGELIISVPNGELKARVHLTLKRFYRIPFIKKCEKREPKVGSHIHMFNYRHLSVLMKSYNFIIDEYINKYNDEYIIMRCHKYVP